MNTANAEVINNVAKEKETVKQAGKFGIVGVINTVIDLGIFNVLYFVFDVNVVIANVVGVSAALLNSYIWNKLWTFKDKKTKHVAGQAFLFVLLSIVGMALNTSVLVFLKDIFVWPGNLAVSISEVIGLTSILSASFIFVNFAKAWGLAVSMIWNFIAYKKIVFKK